MLLIPTGVFTADLLGTNLGHDPRHSKTYVNLFDRARDAPTRFREEVTSGDFPADADTVAGGDAPHRTGL
jgi:ketopantoate hydroxymethyltransferase